MALSGLEIYKMLPKTNCADCGVPTCLAFAMKLAAGQADLDQCPHVSEEVKTALSEAAAPPIRGVTIGGGNHSLKIGEETVMFRHEKRFEHAPGFALLIADDMSEEEIEGRIKKLNEVEFERVGQILSADLVAAKCNSNDASRFRSFVERVYKGTEKGIILISDDPNVIKAGLEVCADRKPLLYAATKENAAAMAEIAKENKCSLAVKGESLEEISEITAKLTDDGLKELVIDNGSRSLKTALRDQIFARRAALKKSFRPLGFPTIVFAGEMAKTPLKETLVASIFVAKYAGIIVLYDIESALLYPLLVERMNIYTDPQRPMTVEEGVYEINSPDEKSPVLITTNFSLTYFVVSSEIEASRVSAWLCIKDSEGLSVLTAWAAGKFVPENIAPFITKSGIKDRVNHGKLVIPGYVAQISGELEEELPDWGVQIGPREAGDIPRFLKEWSA